MSEKKDMIDYLNCSEMDSNTFTTAKVFYLKLQKEYKDAHIDCYAHKNQILFAIDNGSHYAEFEWNDKSKQWEFFYRNRKTNELFSDENLLDFKEIDYLIKRAME